MDSSCDYLKEAIFQFEVGLQRLFGFHEHILHCRKLFMHSISILSQEDVNIDVTTMFKEGYKG